MVFTKRLRDGVRRGRIRCSVRIWQSPRVKAGNRYQMDDGHIVVDSIEPIGMKDVTHDLARESGFASVDDPNLDHGKGHYHESSIGSSPPFGSEIRLSFRISSARTQIREGKVVTLARATVCLPTRNRRVSHAFYAALGFVAVGEPAGDGLPEPLQFEINAGLRVMLIPSVGFGVWGFLVCAPDLGAGTTSRMLIGR